MISAGGTDATGGADAAALTALSFRIRVEGVAEAVEFIGGDGNIASSDSTAAVLHEFYWYV